MKQFSLEEFKKHPNRKVVTRDRKATARIICTDCKSEYPIIALLSYSEQSEGCESYTADGRFSIDGEGNSDLFFDSVKMHGWVNLYRDDDGFSSLGYLRETEESAISEINEKSDRYKHIATIKVTWEEEQE